jgi:hypothetical protein
MFSAITFTLWLHVAGIWRDLSIDSCYPTKSRVDLTLLMSDLGLKISNLNRNHLCDGLYAWFKAVIAHLLSLGWITIFWTFRLQYRYSQERMMGWDIRLISNIFSQLRYIERLSKKSNSGIFTNFACSKIKQL